MLRADDIENLARVAERPMMQNIGGLLLDSLLNGSDLPGIALLGRLVAQTHQVLLTIGPVLLDLDP
jgi:hypothetical protein